MKEVTRGRVTTFTLSGAETVRFERGYPYFEVVNMGDAPVYLSKYEDCTADADGVYTVPAGGGKVARLDTSVIYLSGSGMVQVTAKNEAEPSFKAAAKGGEGGSGYTKGETDALLAEKFNNEKVVDALPETPEEHTLYILDRDAYVYTPVQSIEHSWAANTQIQREGVVRVNANGGNHIVYSLSGSTIECRAYNSDGSVYAEDSRAYNAQNDVIMHSNNWIYYGGSALFSIPSSWMPLAYEEAVGGGWVRISGNFIGENLLINPDFKINQRGQTQYFGEIYTVDRWYGKWTGDGVATVTDDGIRLSRNMYNAFVYQAIENSSMLSNSTLTFSVRHKGNGGDILVVSDFGANHTTYLIHSIPSSSDWTVTTITFTLGDIADGLAIGIGGGYDGTTDVSWAKLEVGSVATPFTHPNPATELLKCQRFYEDISIPMNVHHLATMYNASTVVTSFHMAYKRTTDYHVEVSGGRFIPPVSVSAASVAITSSEVNSRNHSEFGLASSIQPISGNESPGWIDTITIKVDSEIY